MQAHIIAYSKLSNLFKNLEVISNNVANASSSGFKADLAIYLNDDKKIDGKVSPVPKALTATDLSSGALKRTDRQLDVGIDGKGFFAVDTPLGIRYTRNGVFNTATDGTLTTAEGYNVVGDGGNIIIDPSDTSVKIGRNGEVYGVSQQGEVLRGKIQISKFDDTSVLEKVGNSFFKTDVSPTPAIEVTDFKLSQGFVESSNVNEVQQITELIDVTRSVTNLARIMQDQQQLLRATVGKITGTNS
jgi:flagellar basal-body rod protein FlgF